MVSGCQGDFKSATRRIVSDEDSSILLNDTDTFIFSSKTIPGNEKKVSLLENKLSNRGVKIVKPGILKIHASGHAGREDLRMIYRLFNPNLTIPIHGESTFLDLHIELVKSILPKAETLRLINFTGFEIGGDLRVTIVKQEPRDPILIHGKGVEIERSAISERRKMACNGVIFVSLNLQKKIYQIELRGLPQKLHSKQQDIENLVNAHLNAKKFRGTDDLRINLRRFCQQQVGYKPVTLVQEV
jgi:ribonuclease J